MKITTRLLVFLASLFTLFSLVPTVHAFQFKTGKDVSISAEKVVNDTLFVSGTSLVINSGINGDLFCAGEDVVINGPVRGDVLCAAESIKINGPVDGDVRVIASNIILAGPVSRNVTVLSQSLILEPASRIYGDVFFGSQNVNFLGQMDRDIVGSGESVVISGSLFRNATIHGTNLILGQTANIGGNLDYYTDPTNNVSLDAERIKGVITRHDAGSGSSASSSEKTTFAVTLFSRLLGIISFILVGLFLVWLFPLSFEKKMAKIIQKPLISALVGLATLIVTPVIALLLLVTIVGAPLAGIIFLIYVLYLVIASVISSTVLGKLILEKLFHRKSASLALSVILGVISLGSFSLIPVLGPILTFVFFCAGLGSTTLTLGRHKTKKSSMS